MAAQIQLYEKYLSVLELPVKKDKEVLRTKTGTSSRISETGKKIPVEQIAYVDETGIDTCLYREHGWCERGKLLFGKISGHKFKRTGIVAAQMGKSIIAPLQYNGTMDSVLFEAWFAECLLPNLPKNSVIVMDNASFHRKSKLLSLAEQSGFRLIFLPPYSPEYNPIENFWAWLKRYLRKILPLYSSFDDALHSAFQVC